jgi:GT2 family glycosyltransferase
VSIIIPVHRDLSGARTTLRSVSELFGHRDDVEIIVCNDGGGQLVSSMAREYGCDEAELNENRGSYAARNAGIKRAKGDIFAFIDADEVASPDWIEEGVSALSAADYVGGRILIEGGEGAGFHERYDMASSFPVPHYIADMHFAPTANLFVTKEVFARVGLFDERLRSGGDWEFGVRVANAGFRQIYCERAVTHHPVRGGREQLKKIRRVAAGVADVRLRIWKESPAKLIAACAISAASLPLSLLSQTVRFSMGSNLESHGSYWFSIARRVRHSLQNLLIAAFAIRIALSRRR